MHLQFLQWMRWYKNLNELPLQDRPDEELLNDDAALDHWYDGYVRRITSNAGAPQLSGSGGAQASQQFEG